MFDRDLFLQIAKEMGVEVLEDGGKDMINGVEVDAMKIIFEPFSKSIEDMLEEYIGNNKEWCATELRWFRCFNGLFRINGRRFRYSWQRP